MPRRDFFGILLSLLKRLENADHGSAVGRGRLGDDGASDAIDGMGDARGGLQDILHLIHDFLGAFERGAFGKLDVNEHDPLVYLRYEARGNLLKHIPVRTRSPA